MQSSRHSLIALLLIISFIAFSEGASIKRGIPQDLTDPADVNALNGVCWFDNYKTYVYGPSTKEYVPMIRDGGFNPATVINNIPAGAKYLLTFNEPNHSGQGNLTAAAAAALWPKVVEIANNKRLTLVSPSPLSFVACTNATSECDAIGWLNIFQSILGITKLPYYSTHFNGNCYFDQLVGNINKYRGYNKPVWLTEFYCNDATLFENYMKRALAYLETDPLVFRYSWFKGRIDRVNTLLNGSGQLTPLGKIYNEFQNTAIYVGIHRMNQTSTRKCFAVNKDSRDYASMYTLYTYCLYRPVVQKWYFAPINSTETYQIMTLSGRCLVFRPKTNTTAITICKESDGYQQFTISRTSTSTDRFTNVFITNVASNLKIIQQINLVSYKTL